MTCLFLRSSLAVKTHNEVTLFYRHFEPSETFGTDSHQVRNTITGKVDACADVFPRCWSTLSLEFGIVRVRTSVWANKRKMCHKHMA